LRTRRLPKLAVLQTTIVAYRHWPLWCGIVLLFLSKPAFDSADCSPPLRLLISSTELQSPATQLLQTIAQEMHCELVTVKYDARQSRRLRMLQDHKVDIIPEASDLLERHEYAWVSEPYRIERTGIFISPKNKERWPALNLTSISEQQLRVLIPSGWHGVAFEQWRKDMQLSKNGIVFGAASEAMRDMQMNRADVIIATDYTFNIELQRTSLLTRSGDWFHQAPVSFLLSKKRFSPSLRDKFNQVLHDKVKLQTP